MASVNSIGDPLASVCPAAKSDLTICGEFADDHRHGHRFAQRAAQSQNDRAENPFLA
jgi:hypothetical protein